MRRHIAVVLAVLLMSGAVPQAQNILPPQGFPAWIIPPSFLGTWPTLTNCTTSGTVLVGGGTPSCSATPSLTSVLFPAAGNSSISALGTTGIQLAPADGGSYFRVIAGTIQINSANLAFGTGGASFDVVLSRPAAGALLFTGTGPMQMRTAQTTPPTCTINCGTTVGVVGTDTDMIVTLGSGGSPASGFVVTFSAAWSAAPSCIGQMALTGMANTKLPIVVVSTTGGFTVTTNGAAPSNSDKYAFHCFGVS